jgi:Trm5-related predicted tRNA methylase
MTPEQFERMIPSIKSERDSLTRLIKGLSRKAERDEMTSEDYADLDNWTGWRDALNWVLKGAP